MDRLTSELPIWQKAISALAEFRAQHPELGSLPYKERRALWREFLGIPNPPVPSAEDPCRDASCLQCRDIGWVTRRTGKGSSLKEEVIPCPNCSGWEEKLQQLQLEGSGVPEPKRICNFESFHPVPGSNECLEAAWLLAKGQASYKILLMYGGTGNGKTHLAYAAVLEAIKRGMRAQFEYVPELFGALRLAMDLQKGEQVEDVIKRVESCPFLALDDIGVRKETPWQQEILERIINHRYANELPLVATTNKDPKGLGLAVLSRFKDANLSRMVLNSSPDFRVRKKESF